MSKRMLIDGTHPEELRVVVTSGNRLDEYDVETSTKKQLKGNIYLAKVTRVEPSLQAAFVDFGGNRHGFLAFNEIHPDYYQIPIEDREALIAEQGEWDLNATAAQAHADEIADAEGVDEIADADGVDETSESAEAAADEDSEFADGEEVEAAGDADTEAAARAEGEPEDAERAESEFGGEAPHEAAPEVDTTPEEEAAAERVERRRRSPYKRYGIQEVVKRRQILLVQVVKEERGNKGAALTTYISLAGRYCVQMPNTARGGGISRKIANPAARRNLRSILNTLEIPEGMGVIIRTAGMERNRAEIKRDFEYLLRAWDEVRELTLNSTAPTLVYEEASLIKRAIRDLYTKDIEEVLIDGADAYQTAKKFMRLLMPSHAKRVQPYRDPGIPLFFRYQVEGQLDAMHSPVVQLKSGGYLVLHSTEALVAVDVNSGRSTRERNIEETALKTNLEAADEVARQLRLRDLAGLVVIDFIDMEENRNVRAVEKRLKDAMKVDRARIQIGRISAFGLLELSRQRLRPSLIEASTLECPHCHGAGFIRSTESMAVHVLRAIEEEGIRRRASEIMVSVATQVALYILNQKRGSLADIEGRHGFSVTIAGDDSLIPPDFKLDRLKAQTVEAEAPVAITMEAIVEEDEAAAESQPAAAEAEAEEGARRKPRRRRSRRKAGEAAEAVETQEATPAVEEVAPPEAVPVDDTEPVEPVAAAEGEEEGDEAATKRRRRGRRGGRRRSRRAQTEGVETEAGAAEGDGEAAPTEAGESQPVAAAWEPHLEPEPIPEPEPMASTGPESEPEPAITVAATDELEPAPAPEPTPEPEPVATATTEPEPAPLIVAPAEVSVSNGGEGEAPTPATLGNGEQLAPGAEVPPEVASGAANGPKRRGWWQRLVE